MEHPQLLANVGNPAGILEDKNYLLSITMRRLNQI